MNSDMMQGNTEADWRTAISEGKHVPRRIEGLPGDTAAMQERAFTMRGDTVLMQGDTIV